MRKARVTVYKVTLQMTLLSCQSSCIVIVRSQPANHVRLRISNSDRWYPWWQRRAFYSPNALRQETVSPWIFLFRTEKNQEKGTPQLTIMVAFEQLRITVEGSCMYFKSFSAPKMISRPKDNLFADVSTTWLFLLTLLDKLLRKQKQKQIWVTGIVCIDLFRL